MARAVVPAPFGHVEVRYDEEGVVQEVVVSDEPRSTPEGEGRVLDAFRTYFTDDPHALEKTRCELDGTSFQVRVWEALRRIPVGETRTYGDLAEQLDTSARAIGGAVRANPVGLVIPCHRVTAAKGLGGYCGKRELVKVKRWLLEHEGAL